MLSEPITRSVLALWLRNGWVRAGIVVSALVATNSLFSLVVEGLESARDSVSWAVWIYERANTPWLGLFVLVLVGLMLWHGTRQVADAVRQGDKETKLRLSAQDKARRELVLLPAKISLSHAWLQELNQLEAWMEQSRSEMQHRWATFRERWHDGAAWSPTIYKKTEFAESATLNQPRFAFIEMKTPPLQLQGASPTLETVEAPGTLAGLRHHFHHGANRDFLLVCENNLRRHQAWLSGLQTDLTASRANWQRLQLEIKEMLSAYR